MNEYPSTDGWIKKIWWIYAMEYYFALKKEGNSVVSNNMGEPWGHHAKWNKPVTDKYYVIPLIWAI